MKETTEVATIQQEPSVPDKIDPRVVVGYFGIGFVVAFTFCVIQEKLGNLDLDDPADYAFIIMIIILWPLFLVIGVVVGIPWCLMALTKYICGRSGN